MLKVPDSYAEVYMHALATFRSVLQDSAPHGRMPNPGTRKRPVGTGKCTYDCMIRNMSRRVFMCVCF
jgi:hypothetical protein